MRVRVQKDDIIIADSSIIDYVLPDERITQTFMQFGVNVPLLLSRGGTSIKIGFYEKSPIVGLPSLPPNKTIGSQKAIIELIERETSQKTEISIRRATLIKETLFDVTTRIANQEARNEKFVIRFMSMAGFLSQFAVRQIPTQQVKDGISANESTLIQLSNSRIDPASILQKFPTESPAKKYQKSRKIPSRYEKNLSQKYTPTFSKYYGTKDTTPVYIECEAETDYLPCNPVINIPTSKFYEVSTLYVLLEALDKNGVIIDRAIINVPVSDITSDIDRALKVVTEINEELVIEQNVPPMTSAIRTPRQINSNTFGVGVSAVDPLAPKAGSFSPEITRAVPQDAIQRASDVFDSNSVIRSAGSTITPERFSADFGPSRVTSGGTPSTSLIGSSTISGLRAPSTISVKPQLKLSTSKIEPLATIPAEISSITTNQSLELPKRIGSPMSVMVSASPAFISRIVNRQRIEPSSRINAAICPFLVTIDGQTVSAIVKNVPHDVISIQLMKRIPEKKERFFLVGDEIIIGDSTGEVTLFDSDVISGTTYEYKLQFIDKTGNVRQSSNTQVYTYSESPLAEDSLLFNVKSAEKVIREGRSVVEISVESRIQNRGFEEIREILQGAGIPDEVIQESTADPENYGKLVTYEVVRTNMMTGESESLGVSSGELFVDDTAINKRNAKPLDDRMEYQYELRPAIRTPSSYSGNQLSTARDPRTNKEYVFNASKFKSRNDTSTLPSTQELTQKLVGRALLNRPDFYGPSASKVSVPSGQKEPVPVNLKVTKTKLGSNLLQWQTKGPKNNISHFQIWAENDGIEALLGCAHTMDDLHEYEDFEMFNRLGTTIYRIVPVMSNYKIGQSSETATVTNETTLPTYMRDKLGN